MRHAAWLIPNFGGEEWGRGDSFRQTGRNGELTRLWWALFHPDSQILECGKWVTPDWPGALGPVPDAPAFDWIENAGGAVAWFNSAAAGTTARSQGLSLRGAAPEIVRLVHDKAFAFKSAAKTGVVPDELLRAITILEPTDLRNARLTSSLIRGAVARWPAAWAKDFTLKPRLGANARGRLPGKDGQIDEAAVSGALARLAESGGAILEPWLDRVMDFSAHFWISPQGDVRLLGGLEQVVAPSGAFLGHRGVIDSNGCIVPGTYWDDVLIASSKVVAEAAQRSGYFGPCGIDAFCYRPLRDDNADTSAIQFRPAVELNARFSVGTATLGLLARLSGQLRKTGQFQTKRLQHFCFLLEASPEMFPGEGQAIIIDLIHKPERDEGRNRPMIVFSTQPNVEAPGGASFRIRASEGQPL